MMQSFSDFPVLATLARRAVFPRRRAYRPTRRFRQAGVWVPTKRVGRGRLRHSITWNVGQGAGYRSRAEDRLGSF